MAKIIKHFINYLNYDELLINVHFVVIVPEAVLEQMAQQDYESSERIQTDLKRIHLSATLSTA